MSEFALPARYRRALRPGEFDELVDELAHIVERARANGPELLRRSRQPTHDGYPAAKSGTVSAPVGSSDATSVEAAVIRRVDGDGDPVAEAAARMCQALLVARDAGHLALAAWARTVKTDKPCWQCTADRLESDEWCPQCGAGREPSCLIHVKYKLSYPVTYGGRCRWCNDWRTKWLHDHHELRDPSEADIRAHEEWRVEQELRKAA